MNNDKHLTGVRKRQQIADTNKQIMIWVAIASSLVVICIMVAFNFAQDIMYRIKVNSELSNTANTLSESVDNIPKLIKNIDDLSTDKNLTLQNVSSYTDSNGNNQIISAQQVILYSMPTSEDPTELAVALQNLLSASGATVTQISTGEYGAIATTEDGEGLVSTGLEGNKPVPQSIQFTLSLGGTPNDGSIQKALFTLENMTRVITINSIVTQPGITTIRGTAYYTPRVEYKTGLEEVQP